MHEPSMLVRETAAEQLEERQSDWAYSEPVVFEILWNLAFVAVSVAVLILSRDERPNMPLRVWVVGYGIQYGLNMACVCVEYRKSCRRSRGTRHRSLSASSYSSEDGGPGSMNLWQQLVLLAQLEDRGNTSNSTKHLESANRMFSFIWWIIGFYWVYAGGQTLSSDSPQLYWLCIIFLGYGVFVVVSCVALTCVIGFAVISGFLFIIGLVYAEANKVQNRREHKDIE